MVSVKDVHWCDSPTLNPLAMVATMPSPAVNAFLGDGAIIAMSATAIRSPSPPKLRLAAHIEGYSEADRVASKPRRVRKTQAEIATLRDVITASLFDGTQLRSSLSVSELARIFRCTTETISSRIERGTERRRSTMGR